MDLVKARSGRVFFMSIAFHNASVLDTSRYRSPPGFHCRAIIVRAEVVGFLAKMLSRGRQMKNAMPRPNGTINIRVGAIISSEGELHQNRHGSRPKLPRRQIERG